MSDHVPKRRASTATGRGRRVAKRLLVVGLSLVLIVGAVGVGLYKHFEGNITSLSGLNTLKDRPTKVQTGSKEPLNVLVMGSDTRKGQGKAVAGSTPGLSDTTILLHLSADRSSAYGVSIPRDTMVERPACKRKDGKGTDPGGLTQFNAAFAIGGALCTITTVEHITNVHIDHFVVVDFNGFRKMVDALGGVQVCVPEEVNDTTGRIHLAAGTYNVTGEQALDYVRVRHGISANGDIGRMKRQQTFVAAMIKKAVSAGTLANPVRLLKFLNAATSSLTTDPGFAHLRQLASLGESLKNIGLDNVQFVTAPWQPYPEDTNRVELTAAAAGLWKEMRYDRPLGSAYTSQVVKASDSTPSSSASSSSSASPSSGASASSSPSASASSDVDYGDAAVQAGTFTLKNNKAQTEEQKKETAEENGLCT
ncbi:LytR family transcriptional regulator [Nocardioides mangrovicus]|uniref:LytR family transcriptional regulator n=1 Tax=Nocardioides mangrovicus TaxID=2478913 RepID=A0A3L8NWF7_9ACTN|nr:LCP family protein [Nocardioides mangrovicus]RLV47480.1 LytR family transcriptional regulator [Nocardioides mangrovicus]